MRSFLIFGVLISKVVMSVSLVTEAKKELDRLPGLLPENPEVFERACLEERGFSCAFLARAILRGLVPGKEASDEWVSRIDFEKLKRSCEERDAHACYGVSLCYKNGFRVAPSLLEAYSFAKKSCDLGLGRGCFRIGSFSEQGTGSSPDPALAKKFYEKACRLKNTAGCLMLGFSFERGLGTLKDKEAAAFIYSDLCQKGLPLACSYLIAMGD